MQTSVHNIVQTFNKVRKWKPYQGKISSEQGLMDLDECSEAVVGGLEGKTKGTSEKDNPIATFMPSPGRHPNILPSNSEENVTYLAKGVLTNQGQLYYSTLLTILY